MPLEITATERENLDAAIASGKNVKTTIKDGIKVTTGFTTLDGEEVAFGTFERVDKP